MILSFLIELLLLCLAPAFSYVPSFRVIETDVDMELHEHTIRKDNSPIKLRCNDLPKKSGGVDDFLWEYKKCGPGLSLTDCTELPPDTSWQFALCRNHTKLCMGSTLPIMNPTESDSGIYRCLHKNYMLQQFKVNRVVRLVISDPRTSSIEMMPEDFSVDNQTLAENETAVFRCRVRSIQMPHIIWVREVDETILRDARKRTIVFDGVIYQILNVSNVHRSPSKIYTSKLYIQKAQMKDAGTYYCYAMDEKQIETKQVSLTVLPSADSSVSPLWMSTAIALIAIASVTCCISVIYSFTRRVLERRSLTKGPSFVEVPTSVNY